MADIEYSTRAADWLRDAEPDVSERIMSKLEQAAEWPDHFLDATLWRTLLQTQSRRLPGDHRLSRRDEDVLLRPTNRPSPKRLRQVIGLGSSLQQPFQKFLTTRSATYGSRFSM
ncbi:MAG: hypothetical protein U5J98_06035 [Halobacteriales archaeon]|nr:hypothetical protein [Halobacteriales archaeon]